jgi:hypothetical protein
VLTVELERAVAFNVEQRDVRGQGMMWCRAKRRRRLSANFKVEEPAKPRRARCTSRRDTGTPPAACLRSARGSFRLPSPLRAPPSRQGACGPTSDIPARTALRGIRCGPMWRSVWRRCRASSGVALSALCRCQAAFGAESRHAARVFGRRRRSSCTRVVRTQQGKRCSSPHSEPLGR